MKKKIIAGMLAASFVFIMTGCCLSHDWQEAACTEPKTCSKCGETEGEALGHIWEEATCTEPKICKRCGTTEGEALGHTMSEATYWEAAVCSVCGEIGDVLPPAFEELGVKGQLMEVGKTYVYNTLCRSRKGYENDLISLFKEDYGIEGDYANLTDFFLNGLFGDSDLLEINGETVEVTEENMIRFWSDVYDLTDDFENVTDVFMAAYEKDGIDLDARTMAQATVTDYQVFDSDATHEAKEGYEWKTIEMQIVFSDENAQFYGSSIRYTHDNYYQKNEENDEENDEENNLYADDWDNEEPYTVNWKGQEYAECRAIEECEWGDWVGDAAGGLSVTCTFRVAFLLPKGYDGKLFGLIDTGYIGTMKNFAYADDNTLFFRLQ